MELSPDSSTLTRWRYSPHNNSSTPWKKLKTTKTYWNHGTIYRVRYFVIEFSYQIYFNFGLRVTRGTLTHVFLLGQLSTTVAQRMYFDRERRPYMLTFKHKTKEAIIFKLLQRVSLDSSCKNYHFLPSGPSKWHFIINSLLGVSWL